MNSDRKDAIKNPDPSDVVELCYDFEDLPLRMEDSKRAQLIQQMVPALRMYEVGNRDIARRELDELRATVEHACGKKDVQRFFRMHPHILAHPLEGEYRWCIPRKNLASSGDAPDFLLAEMGLLGLEWYGVELESPHAKLFTNKGKPSIPLSNALRRAVEWRAWLRNNIARARQPVSGGGFNLIDIGANIPYYIFIGRRKDLDEQKRASRRQLNRELNVNVCTYDWLMRLLEK